MDENTGLVSIVLDSVGLGRNYMSISSKTRCGILQETTNHVVRCNHDESCSLWDKELKELVYNWMVSHEIIPQMTQCIRGNLNDWKYCLVHPQEVPYNQISQHAKRLQHRIGWKQFLEGFWSTSFE